MVGEGIAKARIAEASIKRRDSQDACCSIIGTFSVDCIWANNCPEAPAFVGKTRRREASWDDRSPVLNENIFGGEHVAVDTLTMVKIRKQPVVS